MSRESVLWYRLLAPLFPAWARLGHPIFTWELRRRQRRQHLVASRLMAALLSAAMVALVAVVIDVHRSDRPLVPHVFDWLTFALLAPSLLLRLATTASTAGAVNQEMEGGTWDSLRATAMPLRDVIGAKWAAGVWSVGLVLGWVTALRGVLVVLLLSDLTRFRGQYLAFLIDGAQPTIPWVVGALAVAAGMTCAVLQPAVTAGLDAATGLLASVWVRNRGLAQVLAGAVRLLPWMVVYGLAWPVVDGLAWMPVTTLGGWLLLLLFAVEGDMALGLLMIDWLAQLYGDVNFGFAIGPAALALLLAQAALAVALIRLAAWRAAKLGERG